MKQINFEKVLSITFDISEHYSNHFLVEVPESITLDVFKENYNKQVSEIEAYNKPIQKRLDVALDNFNKIFNKIYDESGDIEEMNRIAGSKKVIAIRETLKDFIIKDIIELSGGHILNVRDENKANVNRENYLD